MSVGILRMKFTVLTYVILFCNSYFISAYLRIKKYNNKENDPFQKYYLTSTYLLNLEKRNFRGARSPKQCNILPLNLFNSTYRLCLHIYSIMENDIVNNETTVILHANNSQEAYKLQQLRIEFVKGYVVSKPYTSSLSGFIVNNSFYGKVFLHPKTYYLEQLEKFPRLLEKHKHRVSNHNAIIYEDVDNIKTIVVDDYGFKDAFKNIAAKNGFKHKIQYVAGTKNKNAAKIAGKSCTLLLILDYSFLNIICNNDIKSAVNTVLQSLTLANVIFRTTDFDEDGIPDNIGFSVKYIVLMKSENSATNILPKYNHKSIDGTKYLEALSRNYLLSKVCLGVGFTAQPFFDRALGLSYTAILETPDIKIPTVGGICERPRRYQLREYFNCLVVTYRLEDDEYISQVTLDLGLAHEIGHSFGSNHDTKPECLNHLMSPHTTGGKNEKNFLFSTCSKRQILPVLMRKGWCLENMSEPFCGNGLVEHGEDCDCGVFCHSRDLCCVPPGSKGPSCKVNKAKGYQCHPSQGLCCTSTCQYRDISKIGLSCDNFETSDACQRYADYRKCGILGRCINNECHSIECTRLNSRECACPQNIRQNLGCCATCCISSGGKCLPSIILTQDILDKNSSFINHLLNYSVGNLESTNFSTQFVIKFATNGNSVNLLFYSFSKGSYCIFKGDLGMCNSEFLCYVRKSTLLIYPTARQSVSSSTIFFVNKMYYLLVTTSILCIFDMNK